MNWVGPDKDCFMHNDNTGVKFKAKQKLKENNAKEAEVKSETKEMQDKASELKKKLFAKKVKKAK